MTCKPVRLGVFSNESEIPTTTTKCSTYCIFFSFLVLILFAMNLPLITGMKATERNILQSKKMSKMIVCFMLKKKYKWSKRLNIFCIVIHVHKNSREISIWIHVSLTLSWQYNDVPLIYSYRACVFRIGWSPPTRWVGVGLFWLTGGRAPPVGIRHILYH